MLLGLHKNLSFNSGKIYPYATGGDYVYLYEDTTTGKTYRVHEFLSTGTSTLNVEVGGQMDVLVVGGGGSGGVDTYATTSGAGGGAGKFLEYSGKISTGTHTITVGSGGPAVTRTTGNTPADPGPRGKNGNPSSFVTTTLTLTATGGGGGGGGFWGSGGTDQTRFYPGLSGGCGGGAAGLSTSKGLADSYNGDGTAYGNNGGNGSNQRHGGGGGGASSSGGNATTTNGGNGGAGRQWLNGNYYAGGGGGGAVVSTGSVAGSGGIGGGGAGSRGSSATSASPNTGGGGGGAGGVGDPGTATSGAGGSGIVIVRYVVAEKKLWTPEDLGTSVIGWWDASDETTLFDSISGGTTPTDGSEVKRVEDKSSKGIHLYPWTAYNPNLYGPLRKVGYQNNLDCLEFSSSTVSRALVASNSPTSSSRFTIFSEFLDWMNNKDKLTIIAYYPVRANAIAQNVSYQTQQTFNIFSTSTSQITSGTRFGDRNGSATFTNTGYVSNTGGIYCSYFDRNASPDYNYLRHNGTEISTIDLSSSSYTLTWEDGAGEGSRMGVSVNSNSVTTTSTHYESTSPVMGEIIYVNDGTLSNIQKLEGYIAHKWGLTNNLPAGHPYKYEPPYKVEPEEIVTDGLVLNLDAGDYASYPRSGTTWYDISGNGLTGALTNGPTYDSANKGSIVFDGVNDYVSVPDQAGKTDFTRTQNYTVDMWVYCEGTQTDTGISQNMIAEKWSNVAGVGYPYVIRYYNQTNSSPGLFAAGVYDGTNAKGLISTSSHQDKWVHVCITCDWTSKKELKLYINGKIESGVSIYSVTGTIDNSYPLYFAVRAGLNDHWFDGKISSFKIWNRVLSEDEILQNFNALKDRYGVEYSSYPSEVVTDSIVVNLDAGNTASYSGSGSTWTDLSGNNNNATLYNTPTYSSSNNGHLSFDGVNEYAEISASATTNLSSSSITVSTWAKSATSTWSAYWSLVSKYTQFILGPNGQNEIAFLVYTSTWQPTTYNSAIWSQAGTGFDPTQWHNYVGVYNAATNKIFLYVDGVLFADVNTSGTVASDTGPIHLMHRELDSVGTNHLSGSLANVQIYNKALSSYEIQQNFNALRGRYGV